MVKLGLQEEATNEETISPWRINLVLNVLTSLIDITSVDCIPRLDQKRRRAALARRTPR